MKNLLSYFTKQGTELKRSNRYRNNISHYKRKCKKCKWRCTASLHEMCRHCLIIESYAGASHVKKVQKDLNITWD